MHALIEDVLPFLVAFYVLDGLAVVRAYETLLAAPWSPRFRAATKGFSLLGLSPFSELLSAVDSPVRIGSAAVYVESAAAAPGELPELASIPLDGLSVEASDRTVRLGGRSLHLPSKAAAERLVASLRELAALPPSDRGRRIRALLENTADVRAVRALRAIHRRFQRVLSLLGLALFVVTFVLLPAGVAVRWERGPSLATLLLVVLAVHASILGVSYAALTRLGCARPAAVNMLLPLVFFPPSAAHASFAIFRDLYARFDALAVAGAFLPAEDFRALARLEVHRLRREAERGGEVAEWAALREKAWARAFDELGTSMREVLRPPARRDGDAASYCPLCGGEYRAGFAVCTECRVPLEALA
jgi:hypothetical protein